MSSSQGPESQVVDGSVNRAAFLVSQSVRDASDWIRYKKEIRVYGENKTTTKVPSSNPWVPYGNNFRLTFLNGQFKQPNSGICSTCNGPDFNTANGIPLPSPS